MFYSPLFLLIVMRIRLPPLTPTTTKSCMSSNVRDKSKLNVSVLII